VDGIYLPEWTEAEKLLVSLQDVIWIPGGTIVSETQTTFGFFVKTYSRIFTMISRLMAEAVTAKSLHAILFRYWIVVFSLLYGAARALTISGWMVAFLFTYHDVESTRTFH
jgi:hypothetical protein